MNPLRYLNLLLIAFLVLIEYLILFTLMIVARVLPNKYYYRFTQYIYNVSVYIWRLIMFRMNGMSLKIVGDPISRTDGAITLSNHVQSLDMGLINHIASANGPGCGHARYIVKKSVGYIPLFGQVHWLLGDLFLERKWEKDKETLHKYTQTFMTRPNKWLVLFPEGTRAGGKGKLAAAQKYAEEHGLKKSEYVLLPRSKGFTVLVQGFQQKRSIKWVYDLTLLYPNKDLTRLPRTGAMLCGGNKLKVVTVVRRYDIQSLPHEEAAIAQWLQTRWDEKETIYQIWAKSGFDSESIERNLKTAGIFPVPH